MQNTGLPAKFGIPFGNGAAGNYIRPIPQASQIGIQAGAASLTDGFPPVTFLPVAAGGTPPFGQDFNGLLNQITAWVRLLQAGMPVPFDAAFQASIGGYPFKARVLDTTTNIVWESLVNNNTATIGTTNWSVPIFVDPNTAGLIVYGVTNSNGANIRLQGNGAAGNKTIRAQGGHLQVLNNAYSSAILDMDDAGNLTAAQRLRAGIGARGSGDNSAATTLGDFNNSSSGGSGYAGVGGAAAGLFYLNLPNGVIIQGWQGQTVTGNADVITFPSAFPNYCSEVVVTEGNAGGWGPSFTGVTVFGTGAPNFANFLLYCARWTGSGWVASGPSINYRYIAVGA